MTSTMFPNGRTTMKKPPNPLWSLVEKTLATYAQAFLVALLGSSFFERALGTDLTVLQQLAIAAIPAALTVLLNATTSAIIPSHLPRPVIAALRIIRTGGAAFLGYLLAAPYFDLSASLWNAAVSAGAMALLAGLKAELATVVGQKGTLSLLPTSLDPTGFDPTLPPLHT